MQNRIRKLSLRANHGIANKVIIKRELGWRNFEERILKGQFRLTQKVHQVEPVRWAKMSQLDGHASWKNKIARNDSLWNLREGWMNAEFKNVRKAVKTEALNE